MYVKLIMYARINEIKANKQNKSIYSAWESV